MPMMAFIGVRISWLMLATKSDLARLASSAFRRATLFFSMRSSMSMNLAICRARLSPSSASHR